MIQLTFGILVGIAIVVCLVFGLLLLFLSIPHDVIFNNYRICRKLLAIAYLIMAGVNIMGFFVDSTKGNPFITPYITLIISSFQSFLFTYALITLINIDYLSKKRLIKELIPITIITVFCAMGLIIKLPSTILDAIFHLGTAYYIFQLVKYTLLFNSQFRSYQDKLNSFFSEKESLRLRWVRFSFYFALSIGIIALTSVFVTSIVIATIFIAIYAFFYIYFGIKYLNHLYVFNTIEPVAYAEPVVLVEPLRLSNDELADAVQNWIQRKGFVEKGITLVDLAAHLNTNRTYLSNYINQQKEMNFNAWINRLRVEEGKMLLIEKPQIPIAQVSELLGYSEQSNFGRYFLKYTSTTPRLWRQEFSK